LQNFSGQSLRPFATRDRNKLFAKLSCAQRMIERGARLGDSCELLGESSVVYGLVRFLAEVSPCRSLIVTNADINEQVGQLPPEHAETSGRIRICIYYNGCNALESLD
jgi:hypothetical protein